MKKKLIDFFKFYYLRVGFDNQADFFALKSGKENVYLFQFAVWVLNICKTFSAKSAMT